MRKLDYYILTKDYVLSRIGKKEWKIFEYQDYYPEVMPFHFTNILDDWEVFLPVMKSIVKTSRKQSSKIKIMKPSAMFMSIDERNSKLVKKMIFESFLQLNYYTVEYTEIAAVAVCAWDKLGLETPVIIILVIGNVVQFSFCFAGGVIIKHVVQESHVPEFNEFVSNCKELQKEDFTTYVDMRHVRQEESNYCRVKYYSNCYVGIHCQLRQK